MIQQRTSWGALFWAERGAGAGTGTARVRETVSGALSAVDGDLQSLSNVEVLRTDRKQHELAEALVE